MEKTSTTGANSLLFSNDHSDSQHVEVLKLAKYTFLESERRKYVSQIEDLQMSLEINKGIICDLLQCKSVGQIESALIVKFRDEAMLLRNRINLQ
jgi:hypothetical protein